MTDKEKIKYYLEKKGISKNKFYTQTGLSVGFLDSGNSLGVDKAKVIINTYPDLNLDWLVLGEGEMIRESATTRKQNIEILQEKERTIALLEENAALLRKQAALLEEKIAFLEERYTKKIAHVASSRKSADTDVRAIFPQV